MMPVDPTTPSTASASASASDSTSTSSEAVIGPAVAVAVAVVDSDAARAAHRAACKERSKARHAEYVLVRKKFRAEKRKAKLQAKAAVKRAARENGTEIEKKETTATPTPTPTPAGSARPTPTNPISIEDATHSGSQQAIPITWTGAMRQPDVILHVDPCKKHRWETLFNERKEEWKCTVIPTPQEPSVVFLSTPSLSAASSLYHYILHDPILVRHTYNVFICSHQSQTMNDLVKEESLYQYTMRIQAYPRTILQPLIDLLPDHIKLHPKSYTHILFVVNVYNRFYWSLLDTTLNGHWSSNQEIRHMAEVECRAFFKLEECYHVYTEIPRITQGCIAMDIGAAPGGWSGYLASLGATVLAVDPAHVNIPTDVSGRVIHVPKKIEDATAEITQFGLLDMVVCDMNVFPKQAASIILSVAHFMKPGATLILTLKAFSMSKTDFVNNCAVALESAFSSVHITHLFSNGHERTLIARRRDTYDPQQVKAAIELMREQAKQRFRSEKLHLEKQKQALGLLDITAATTTHTPTSTETATATATDTATSTSTETSTETSTSTSADAESSSTS